MNNYQILADDKTVVQKKGDYDMTSILFNTLNVGNTTLESKRTCGMGR
jgi:hypothetical protein